MPTDADSRPLSLQRGYSELLEALPDAMVVLKASGVIVLMNAQAERQFGYRCGELNNQELKKIIPGGFCTRLLAESQRFASEALAQRATPAIEIVGRHKNGRKFPLEIRLSQVKTADGILVVAAIRDITVKKRAEYRLRAKELRFSMIYDNTHESMFVISVQPNDVFRFISVNRSFTEATGMAHAQVIGKLVEEILPEPSRTFAVNKYQEAIQTRLPVHWEEVSVYPSGKKVGEVTVAPIYDSKGHCTHLIGTVYDITDRNKAADRIAYLIRVYAMLSSINSLVVHVHDRNDLYSEACRIAVAEGGFRMALIVIVDKSSGKMIPAGSASKDQELLGAIEGILSATQSARQTMVGQVISDKTLLVSNDSQNDPRVLFGKKYGESGVRSLAIFPLIALGEAIGVFALYANEIEFFHEEELKLLEELAGDISFALTNIRRQEKLAMLARIRAVSSAINAAIIRTQDRAALLSETCRIAVEEGAFKMAWIGELGAQGLEGGVVARCGGEDAYVENVRLIASGDSPDNERPACRALRSLQPFLCNDVATDSSVLRYRDDYLKRGHKSIGCFPLTVPGRPPAVLSLFAGDTNAFDEEETALLLDVSANISFALEKMDSQQKLINLSRIRALSGEINAAILRIHSREELFREACRIAVGAGGFSLAWMGVVDGETMQLKPVAWEGPGLGYIEQIPLGLDEADAENFGLIGHTVRDKRPTIVEDLQVSPRVRLREESIERGFHSLVTLPLQVADTVIGVLVLYAKEIGFFDDSEMKLLLELAANISFALDHIAKAEKLDYLAYYDVLTGLANRSLFLERVAQYIRSAATEDHKLCLFLVDLARFKNINDTLGRPAGDTLLRKVAQWLISHAGDVGLLARVGPDNFAVVLPNVKQGRDAVRIVERTIEALLLHPFRLNDAEFRVSAKVGAALFPEGGTDADTLFRNAEAALKKAKATGEPYLFHTERMTEMVAGKLTLENQLRRALDNGEFVLHYQPKVSIASGKLTGAEALIRWKDPRTGLVPPGKFIPILEETGLIHDVGRWALRQAVEDYLRWRREGLASLRIAVNVSALQLRNRSFIDEVTQAIAVDETAAQGLELEITESVIMDDITGNIGSLGAIRALGVRIAIDDFGTGFSSLNYLAKLPVDTLKIDRSFVVGLTAGPEGAAMVATIIDLAHSLKLKVVAEGVETEEQLRLLRLMACDEMQGFLISKPLPSDIFEARYLTPNVAVSQ